MEFLVNGKNVHPPAFALTTQYPYAGNSTCLMMSTQRSAGASPDTNRATTSNTASLKPPMFIVFGLSLAWTEEFGARSMQTSLEPGTRRAYLFHSSLVAVALGVP